MPGFITTDNGEWEFSFEDKVDVPDLPVHDPLEQQGPMAPGYLEGPGKWENYTDNYIYELESLLRKWFEARIDSDEWRSDKRGFYRRYTCKLMFEQLYGRLPDPKDHDDRTKIRRMPKLLAYYSSKIQKGGSIRGKNYSKTIYTLSPRLYRNRPPYNLKLRLEWLSENGKMPTWYNMKLPKDDLKPGHARNKRSEENMRLRSERAKQRFNERYNRNRKR